MQTSAFGFSGEALPHRQKRNPISAKVARPATFVARLAKKVAGLATFAATVSDFCRGLSAFLVGCLTAAEIVLDFL